MRIRITAGGIYGLPPSEGNPSGELPIGHEMTVENVPPGWAGRYIDLDADPAEDEERQYVVGELTKELVFDAAGLTNLSDLQAVLDAVEKALTPNSAPLLPEGPYLAKDLSGGWWGIHGKNDAKVGKSIRKDEAEAFNKLDDAGKAKFAADHLKAAD